MLAVPKKIYKPRIRWNLPRVPFRFKYYNETAKRIFRHQNIVNKSRLSLSISYSLCAPLKRSKSPRASCVQTDTWKKKKIPCSINLHWEKIYVIEFDFLCFRFGLTSQSEKASRKRNRLECGTIIFFWNIFSYIF